MAMRLVGFLGLAAASLMIGCGERVDGEWMSQSVTPAMARDQLKFLRPANFNGEFVKATIELKKDKKYIAEVYYAGELGYSSGTWMYDSGRINFLDDKYGSHVYRAELARAGRELKIITTIKGTDVVLSMRRAR